MKKYMMTFAMACIVLLMVGCEKQKDTFDSFTLNMKGFADASGAKTHWDNNVFWWDSGDQVIINGSVFNVVKDGTKWKATAVDQGATATDGYFYLAYPFVDDGIAEYHPEDKTYGTITFDGSVIPLAAKSNNNSMTLTPCCAVIKLDTSVNISFPTSTITSKAYINIVNEQLSNSQQFLNRILAAKYMTRSDGKFYYAVPIIGESVTCSKITFGTGRTAIQTNAVTLEKGKLYVVNIKDRFN